MQEHFGYALDQIIENYSDSKNLIIQKSGIDRSTFFQILKGKRLPTNDQLRSILNVLPLSTTDEEYLRQEYMMEKLGHAGYENRKSVLNILNVLKSSDNPSWKKYDDMPAVLLPDTGIDLSDGTSFALHGSARIRGFLNSAMIRSGKQKNCHLDLFAPLSFLIETDFFNLLESIFSDVHSGKNPEKSKKKAGTADIGAPVFRHVISLSSKSLPYSEDVLNDYCEYLRFLTSFPHEYKSYYYYDNINMDNGLGTIFPYYMIFPFGVLLIDRSFSNALYTSDPLFLAEYSRCFEQNLSQMKPMLSNTSSIEECIPYYLSLPDDTKTWYITWTPGLSYIANDQLIEKYTPAEYHDMYKLHCRSFQHTVFHEYVSPEGLLSVIKNGSICELGMNVSADKNDFDMIINIFSTRLGKNLSVIDPDHFPISRNWSVYVIAGQQVAFVPIVHGERTIFIHEKKLVDSFEDFFTQIEADSMLLSPDRGQELLKM